MRRERILAALRDIRRGAGNLPHVGHHPGAPILGAIVALGAIMGLATVRDGSVILAALAGAAFIGIPMGAIFAAGCLNRARLSDRLSRKHETKGE